MGKPRARETGYRRALRDFLDTFADHDEQWAGRLQLEVAARLVGLARPRIDDACLDIGGGEGIVAAALCEAVGPRGSVVSLDVGKRSTTTARAPATGDSNLVRIRGGDVFFRDCAFDVVVLARSIAYEADAHAIIAEAIRILKAGGRLALFCRRRGLATRAEEVFLEALSTFVQQQPVSLPDQFARYPALADRSELEAVLSNAGLEHITFGDVVTGGRTVDAAGFIQEMIGCWPAARVLVGSLAGRKRLQFEQQLAGTMTTLGDDAFRYHHPYLLAAGMKARTC